MAKVLLTTPKIQFFDNNGDPLSGGKIYTYVAGTTTPKDSYTDSSGSTANANPVILDSAGRADIWIEGSYKIVVKDSNDVTLSTTDNITNFSSSTSNTFTDSTFVIQDNSDSTKQLQFECSSINTASTTTITVPNGNATMVTNTGTQTLTNKTLTSPTITTPVYAAEASIASATTTDLASGSSNYVSITGTTTITSFGSNAATTNPVYFGRFTGVLTLTHNATSLILPGGASITTAAGDTFIAKYEGSGNWRVIDYQKANGQSVLGGGLTTIASGNLATGSPTVVDITSIPATYKSLILYINGASNTVATRALRIELGDSTAVLGGGGARSNYTQIASTTVTNVNAGTSLIWTDVTQTAAQVTSARIDIPDYQSGPIKRYTGTIFAAATAGSEWSSGTPISVSGVLTDGTVARTLAVDRIRITWDNVGTGVFDGGTYALYGVN
jgi:hypothetical protein